MSPFSHSLRATNLSHSQDKDVADDEQKMSHLSTGKFKDKANATLLSLTGL